MKILMGLVGLVLVAVGGVSVAAMGEPDQLHVERQIEIAATVEDMAPFASDVKKINEWSPWNEMDPNIKQEFSDPTSGVGAWYSWEGNDEVGRGKASITSSEPGKVVTGLEFYAPMEGVADASISYTQSGDKITVVWEFDQDNDFPGKVAGLFMDLDAMIGDSYVKGLGMLKPLVEKAAAERIAEAKRVAEEQAKAEAAPEAQAPEEIDDQR